MIQLAIWYSLLQNRLQGSRDRGATAVEYGLLVGLIAVAIVAIVFTLGGQLSDLFTTVSDKLTPAAAE